VRTEEEVEGSPPPEDLGPRGVSPPFGLGGFLGRLKCGDPNPRTPTLSLREVSNRSGIDLHWLRGEAGAGRIGRMVDGQYEVPEDEVDRLRLRWLRRRRTQVNDSGRGFRRGGVKYRHDGKEPPQ